MKKKRHMWRRLKKKTELKDDTFRDDTAAVGSNDDPAAYIEKKERMYRIQNAIDRLPPDQRTLIVLRDIEGFSYDEISKITGHKLGTVKSKLSRARNDLRNRLTGIF